MMSPTALEELLAYRDQVYHAEHCGNFPDIAFISPYPPETVKKGQGSPVTAVIIIGCDVNERSIPNNRWYIITERHGVVVVGDTFIFL